MCILGLWRGCIWEGFCYMKNARCESWKVSYSRGVISIPLPPDILSGENSLFPVISLTHQHSSLNLILVISFLSEFIGCMVLVWRQKNVICIVFLVAEKPEYSQLSADISSLLQISVKCFREPSPTKGKFLSCSTKQDFQHAAESSGGCGRGVASPEIHFTFAFHSTTCCSSLTSLCLLYRESGDDKLIRCCHHNCN